ncbi:hypothetical protein Tco_0227252 [Tanacetum coccineum]
MPYKHKNWLVQEQTAALVRPLQIREVARTFHDGNWFQCYYGGTEGAVHQGPVVLESLSTFQLEEKKAQRHLENVEDDYEGYDVNKDDRESQLYDEFEHFRQIKGEGIQGYYVRFTKLINDIKKIQDDMSRMKLNSNDQLLCLLKQIEVHANENRIMMERFGQPNTDPLALVSDASAQQYPTQSSKSPNSTEPYPSDNFQMNSGSSSTENLIESLTNSLALYSITNHIFSNKQSTESFVNCKEQCLWFQDGKLWFKIRSFQNRGGVDQSWSSENHQCATTVNGLGHIARDVKAKHGERLPTLMMMWLIQSEMMTMLMASLTSEDPISDKPGPHTNRIFPLGNKNHDAFVDHMDEYLDVQELQNNVHKNYGVGNISFKSSVRELLNKMAVVERRNSYTGGWKQKYIDDISRKLHKKPDLTFFRVFGALCYPTNDSENLGKFQAKADIGIFVGFGKSSSGNVNAAEPTVNYLSSYQKMDQRTSNGRDSMTAGFMPCKMKFMHLIDLKYAESVLPNLCYGYRYQWTTKCSLHEYGDVLENKARLVARDIVRRKVLILKESFAPVLQHEGHLSVNLKVLKIWINLSRLSSEEKLYVDDGDKCRLFLGLQLSQKSGGIFINQAIYASRNLNELWNGSLLTLSINQCWSIKETRSRQYNNYRAEYIAMSDVVLNPLEAIPAKGLTNLIFSINIPLFTMAEQMLSAQPPYRTDEQIVPRSRWLTIGKSNLSLQMHKRSKEFQFSVICGDILKYYLLFPSVDLHLQMFLLFYLQSVMGRQCHIIEIRKVGCIAVNFDEQWFDLSDCSS